MKVLHLITALNRGGIESWLLSMLQHVPRSAYEMDVCCKGSDVGVLASAAIAHGARVFHCPLRPTHVEFCRNLRRIIGDGGYDIVHNHLEAYSGVASWVGNRIGTPVITSFHNTRFAPQTWTRMPGLRQLRALYSLFSIRYAVQHSGVVTGCSQSVIDAIDRFVPNGRADFRVLRYGIDLPSLPLAAVRAKFRASFGWPIDTPIVLHVGRFLAQKNHRAIIEVHARVLERIPMAKLFLVGDGPLRQQVEQTVQGRGLGDSVRFLGVRSDVPALMGLCDVFLFPSVHEGLPVAALEAAAAGLPLVGSRVPGLVDVVRDGETGLLHELHDVAGMSRSVMRIVLKEDGYANLGCAARAYASQEFSARASAQRLMQLYDECLSLS